MIWDATIELGRLEDQLEVVQVTDRISQLKSDYAFAVRKFDQNPDQYNQRRLQKIEEDMKFFNNILYFWKKNYEAMHSLSVACERQARAINEGERLLGLIEDLREGYKYEMSMNATLLAWLCDAKLYNNGLDVVRTDRMEQTISKLSAMVGRFLKLMDLKIKELTR